MGVLQHAFRTAFQSTTNRTLFDSWRIVAGKEVHEAATKAYYDPFAQNVGFDQTPGILPVDWFVNCAMVIDEFSQAESTYSDIARHRLFRQLYQYEIRSVAYVYGTKICTWMKDTFPCQVCGVVTLADHGSIDHVRPQTGGKTEAVAKVLRILGLTMQGGKGDKSRTLAAGVGVALQNTQGLGAGLHILQVFTNVPAVPTKGGASKVPGIRDQNMEERYTLNWQGALFYSAAIGMGCKNALETRCMHSIVNLRPLCGRCNSSRQNPVKFV